MAVFSHRSSRKGSVAVLVLLLLGVLLGMAALVVDLGYQQMVKRQLQGAADAAAMSATPLLNGTATGLDNARNTAVAIAALSTVGGSPLLLNANAGNAESGDVVLGRWANGSFTPSMNPALVNAVRVRARQTSLPVFFSAPAFGQSSLGAYRDVIALQGEPSGAGGVPYYLPFGLASCTLNSRTDSQILNMTLVLNPAGADNTGWALTQTASASNIATHIETMVACMQEYGESGSVSEACTSSTTEDTLYLNNGTMTSAFTALVNAFEFGLPWDSDTWGTLPARNASSAIPVSRYGKTITGPVPVFAGDSSYCSGGGGRWNRTQTITGYVWGAIYDVRTSGGASSKNIWMKLDTSSYRMIATSGGGTDYGIATFTRGVLVQ
jgi:hypothetical protein